MSDAFHAFYNTKIKPSLSEFAFSARVSEGSESRPECFVTGLDWARPQGWGWQGPSEHHYFKTGNFLSSSPNAELTWTLWSDWFLSWGKKCNWVGFCNGEAKKDVFLQWDVQNNQEASGSSRSVKGCCPSRPYSASEDAGVSWGRVLNCELRGWNRETPDLSLVGPPKPLWQLNSRQGACSKLLSLF